MENDKKNQESGLSTVLIILSSIIGTFGGITLAVLFFSQVAHI